MNHLMFVSFQAERDVLFQPSRSIISEMSLSPPPPSPPSPSALWLIPFSEFLHVPFSTLLRVSEALAAVKMRLKNGVRNSWTKLKETGVKLKCKLRGTTYSARNYRALRRQRVYWEMEGYPKLMMMFFDTCHHTISGCSYLIQHLSHGYTQSTMPELRTKLTR